MRKFFIFIIILISIISVISYFTFDTILKNYVINSVSKKIEKKISLDQIKTNLFKGTIVVKNLSVADNSQNKKKLIEIQNTIIDINVLTLLSETVSFNKVNVDGVLINYKASIVNGKIVDNFGLINQFLDKKKKNESSINKQTQDNKEKKSENKKDILKSNNTKNEDKNFVIKNLNIPLIVIQAEAKDLNFYKKLKIDSMNFQNVGNTKDSNHYKDVLAMIATNIVIKLNNESIANGLKQKFENKIKKLMKKDNIQNKIESLLGKPVETDKILKKLDKFFK
ncbi:hypothetical protein OAM54_02070 [Pelagibacteraceae bacterium]|nr:hypothetical protein [Pelagibacteraceae bacterium]